MNSNLVQEAIARILSIHLRELPNTALEAACDLASIAGPEAVVRVVNEEISARKLRSIRY